MYENLLTTSACAFCLSGEQALQSMEDYYSIKGKAAAMRS